MNINERKEVLKAAGIETGNFAAFDVPEGATIIIATPDGKQHQYDKYGNPIDEVIKKIVDIGFIKADPDFRRWVTAQTFDILYSGMSMAEYIKYYKKGYYYQFTQTLDELDSIAEMREGERKDHRKRFFTRNVVISLCEDYLKHLHEYVDKLETRSCYGLPYKKVKGFGKGVYVKDIEGKVFSPLEAPLLKIKKDTWINDHEKLATYFGEFVDRMIKIDAWDFKLNEDWLSAYKGAGAYYTLMSLIKFNNCRVYKNGSPLGLLESVQAVEDKVKECSNWRWCRTKPDWYLLYGMMKEVIRDNKFDFRKLMQEVYG